MPINCIDSSSVPTSTTDNEFVVQTESSYPYFQEVVQSRVPAPKPGKGSIRTEEALIKKAYAYVMGKVQNEIDAIKLSSTVPEASKPDQVRDALLAIRDRVLSLQLIFVEVSSEEDAHVIFETLNTRGKDLSVADLVKNHVYRLYPKKNKGLDRAKDKWEELRSIFEDSDTKIDLASFLHHYWLSRKDWVGKNKLFKNIRRDVKQKSIVDFLDELLESAVSYRSLLEPNYRSWRTDEIRLRRSIEAMNTFRIKQTLPIMLTGLDLYQRKDLKRSNFLRLLETLEHFHFSFTAVTSQTPTGGTSKMYAMHARKLYEASDEAARRKVIDDLRAKLIERMPDKETFLTHFRTLRFTKDVAQHRDVLKYAIFKAIVEPLGAGGIIEVNRLSIEHLGSTSTKKSWIGQPGNLLLVPPQVNNEELGNKPFAEKKKILKERAREFVDPSVLSAKQWGEAEVIKRTDELAELSYTATQL